MPCVTCDNRGVAKFATKPDNAGRSTMRSRQLARA